MQGNTSNILRLVWVALGVSKYLHSVTGRLCNNLQAPADHKNLMSAEWGKLSCSVLAQEWDGALEDLSRLRREIDDTVSLIMSLTV